MTVNDHASQQHSTTGSPSSGEPVFLVIGKLHHPHGVHGDIIMQVLTDFPERLKPNMVVFIGEEHRPLRVKTFRQHHRGVLVDFYDYATPEAVGELRNYTVYVKASELPVLPTGEYYHHQVIGLRVVDESGVNLGQVTEILTTGANDVFVVQQETGAEFLLPMVDEMVLYIDLEKCEMCARPLPGLIPEKPKKDA
ncbi:MAG: 16S rRNA processing protein RimM [Anaerolineales bacterium]|nr:16S rRNA processing protein RimM [Anaerolineales bacterium]